MPPTMRLALLSDPHANLPALRAVLEDVDRFSPDQIWCAGDFVGYNPWPNEVLDLIRARRVHSILGNHDRAVLTGDTSWFNELAAAAIRWTRVHLAPAGFGYLKGLEPQTRLATAEGTIAMYHGSPQDDDEYVLPWTASEDYVRMARAEFVILGHTHIPMAYAYSSGFLVNPGSVGQPRDNDPRAAWALLDTSRRTYDLRRVPYDTGAVAAEIHRAGLPEELGDRLHAGV